MNLFHPQQPILFLGNIKCKSSSQKSDPEPKQTLFIATQKLCVVNHLSKKKMLASFQRKFCHAKESFVPSTSIFIPVLFTFHHITQFCRLFPSTCAPAVVWNEESFLSLPLTHIFFPLFSFLKRIP
jgi:hypothetical protein